MKKKLSVFFLFFFTLLFFGLTSPFPAQALFEQYIYGNVFIDANENGRKDTGEANYQGPITITAIASGGILGNSTSVRTTQNGTYTIMVDNGSGARVRVSYTSLPANYKLILPSSGSFTVGIPGILSPCILGGSPDAYCQEVGILDEHIFNLNFAIVSPYAISGNVFIDGNQNGLKDSGETNYLGPITITSSKGVVTTTGVGTYLISNLRSGSVTVSYPLLPSGYRLTYPLTGPPPTFSVFVGGLGCNTNGSNGATCVNRNITNLNFGITNLFPWFQSICGDVRIDNGITDAIPSTAVSGAYLIANNVDCTTPGTAYTGDSSYDLGEGQISTSRWVVGGTVYPEVHKPSDASGIRSSYNYLSTKARRLGIVPINLASVCTLSNCTLPANLPHGIYRANGNVTLNAYTFPANQNYVILVNGNLTLQGRIVVPNGSTAYFSSSGNTTVVPALGSAISSTATSLEGIYSSDRSFIVDTTGTCGDLRLNLAGTVITNAGLAGGSFQNRRDLCANNRLYPTVSLFQRLDFFLNLPDFTKVQSTVSQEVAP